MTNEMKLLLALCDALGFKVYTDHIYDDPSYTPETPVIDYKLTKKEPVWIGVDLASDKDYTIKMETQLTPEGVRIMEEQFNKIKDEQN